MAGARWIGGAAAGRGGEAAECGRGRRSRAE